MSANEFQSMTRRPDVSFAQQNVAPPSNLYIDPADELVIVSYSSAAGVLVDVKGRFLSTRGEVKPFNFEHIPNSDRSLAARVENLGEGFLLNISAVMRSGTAKRGQIYVALGLARGSGPGRFIHTIIAKGYVASGVDQVWPGNRLMDPTEGPGYARFITGTNPAAGVEIAETVPTGARWRVMSARLNLATDATVANRRASLVIDDGSTLAFVAQAPAVQAASLNYNYYFAPGVPHETAVLATSQNAGLPHDLYLSAGYRLRTITSGMVAGDDYAAPVLLVEEWIEP